MNRLEYSELNLRLVQDFLDETKNRIKNGAEIVFTGKANLELKELMLLEDIFVEDIKEVLEKLTPQDYYRGIDISGEKDYNICAFSFKIGKNSIEIYFKYGLEKEGDKILIFSNHEPNYIMDKPFKL